MKSTLYFFLVCFFFACQPPEVEPVNSGKQVPDEPSAQNDAPSHQTAPAKNCEVTITNKSRFARVHLYLNGKSVSNLVGACAIEKGSTVSICIKPGTHQLYVFSNMYQFSPAKTIIIPETGKVHFNVRSGP